MSPDAGRGFMFCTSSDVDECLWLTRSTRDQELRPNTVKLKVQLQMELEVEERTTSENARPLPLVKVKDLAFLCYGYAKIRSSTNKAGVGWSTTCAQMTSEKKNERAARTPRRFHLKDYRYFLALLCFSN